MAKQRKPEDITSITLQAGIDSAPLDPGRMLKAQLNGPAPEVWGFGLEKRDGGYVACRVSNRGTVEYFGPKTTAGEHRVESKALALSRAFDEFKAAYAPSTKLRYG